MQEQTLDEAPIWTNLKAFDGKPWRGKVDCITGGYPCQPFSIAGKKLGDKDPRHLWPHVKRIVEEIEPPICLFENVGGHLRLGFEQVHDGLQAMGYQVKVGLFTAEEVGAPHKRERLFILAYRSVIGRDSWWCNLGQRHLCEDFLGEPPQDQSQWKRRISGLSTDSTDVADSEKLFGKRSEQCRNQTRQSEEEARGGSGELADPESTGTGQHISGIRQGIARNNSELENAECIGCGRRCDGMERRNGCKAETSGTLSPCSEVLGDTNNKGLEGRECSICKCSDQLTTWPPSPSDYEKWEQTPAHLKPDIHRMADGLANRLDRVRACGNGIVPLVAAYAWRTLSTGMHLTKDTGKQS